MKQKNVLPFLKQRILDNSKLKEFAENNFKLMKITEISPKG